MKLLADQDVYAATVAFLRQAGHDVVTVADLTLSQASDSALLSTARGGGRLLLTRDRDFGNLIFAQAMQGGVIYLRMLPATVDAVHGELSRVLAQYAERDLLDSFVVVEPGRHRLRSTPH
jgi:predicted nuclease of predicted toxin-antitoxin system